MLVTRADGAVRSAITELICNEDVLSTSIVPAPISIGLEPVIVTLDPLNDLRILTPVIELEKLLLVKPEKVNVSEVAAVFIAIPPEILEPPYKVKVFDPDDNETALLGEVMEP